MTRPITPLNAKQKRKLADVEVKAKAWKLAKAEYEAAAEEVKEAVVAADDANVPITQVARAMGDEPTGRRQQAYNILYAAGRRVKKEP